MKNILIIFMIFAAGIYSATAQEKKNKNAKHTIEVNGTCEQCKKRIEKAAYSVPGVKSASWDIATHDLQLILNEEKSDTASVMKAVAKAGHDNEGQKATDADYNNLHHCCLYERK